MADENISTLSDVQKEVFEKIRKNDLEGFKMLIAQVSGGVNFVDENGMTPLQHACCKGNKEAVQILLDMGADIDYNQHGANYTPLHFAALSGKTEVCRILLDAGINPNSVNSVSRTAAQMAAFVGNHACVETISNYVPKSVLEYYTKPQGLQTEPLIPQEITDAFHELVVTVNLHPVRIVLNLQALGLLKHLESVKKVLQSMCEQEMKKTRDPNELQAFKYHYLQWILVEVKRCEEQNKTQKKDNKSAEAETGKHDFVELFIKRVLKENKLGQLDYVEFMVRECVREFPFRECTVFRNVITQLAAKEPLPALTVLRNAINGHRGFVDDASCCSTCGNEKPDKKCSKCKAVQYCDRECQRLHWFTHKKNCARITSNANGLPAAGATVAGKGPIDTNELRAEIAKMSAS